SITALLACLALSWRLQRDLQSALEQAPKAEDPLPALLLSKAASAEKPGLLEAQATPETDPEPAERISESTQGAQAPSTATDAKASSIPPADAKEKIHAHPDNKESSPTPRDDTSAMSTTLPRYLSTVLPNCATV
ncbi:unnamed protein product, partial [Symbiodinium pilosum]